MKRVYTTGVFDILHTGHLTLLQEASTKGDALIVGVQEDEAVRKQKGRYPTMTCHERIALLKSLPFVHEVVSYKNPDQREMLKKIKPSVMVQGNDWLQTADRTKILEYLKKNEIDLELIPYTRGISSTQIKARLIEQYATIRNDINILRKSLKIIPIEKLCAYERSDPKRVKKLVSRIKKGQVFVDPITVGHYENTYTIIDGANRIEALEQLQIPKVLANVVSYADPMQVELTSNAHFIELDAEVLIERLAKNKIKVSKVSKRKAEKELANSNTAATIKFGDDFYIVPRPERIEQYAETVNSIVSSYISTCKVNRLSELSHDAVNKGSKIIFGRFTIEQINEIIRQGLTLESGVTWHKIRNSIIRVDLPLSFLTQNISEFQANKKLQSLIERKLVRQEVRYYPYGVYLCDDWG